MAQSAAAAAAFVGDLTMFAQTEDMVVVATDVDSADARDWRLDIQPSEAVHAPCRFRETQTRR